MFQNHFWEQASQRILQPAVLRSEPARGEMQSLDRVYNRPELKRSTGEQIVGRFYVINKLQKVVK